MNVGRGITQACREQRRRDLNRLALEIEHRYAVQAYCWWGWDINGRGGIGRPGYNL